MDDQKMRFSGIQRLVGESAYNKLLRSHVMIVGLGGVGSWTAESLARSAVGTLSLVDFDDICITNTNRQIQALSEKVGGSKIKVLAERIQQINPACQVQLRDCAFDSESADSLLSESPDVVVDAIDSLKDKSELLHQCRLRSIPVVSAGGAGGRIDPQKIKVTDLAHTRGDPLFQKLRKKLRQGFGFPSAESRQDFAIRAVYSDEVPRLVNNERPCGPLDCNTGYGTASFVTGVFGFHCAAETMKILTSETDSAASAPGPEPAPAPAK